MTLTLRQKVSFYLEDIETPLGKAINLCITGLVLLSSVIFVVETYPIPSRTREILETLETGIVFIFLVEYGLRLWCAENRWRFATSLLGIVDLIAILPFLLGAMDFRFIRIFRWFRILRLIRFIEGKTVFGYVTSEDSAIAVRILFTIFSIIFVYSGIIYQVEHPINSDAFTTFLDAVYFSVSTLSTAGFGDIVPISQLGRLMTILMILTGILLIPWQLGDLIKRLVKTSDRQEISCTQCGLAVHDKDAYFCKQCGTPLPLSSAARGHPSVELPEQHQPQDG
ncbi:MAG TPA: ion transporter [Synechococcales cyanobacterium M55_K2018_004]|nr:ion transporter [Synechococcales cyanobacterium M55_K2018_004]